MIFNNTEVDSAPAVEEYTPKATWGEVFSAANESFKAVSLSTSETNYYTDERDTIMEDWKAKDPENTWVYDQVGTTPKAVIDKLQSLYEDGNTEAIKNWNSTGTGETFLKFKELQQFHGFKDVGDIRKDAEARSLKDYTDNKRIISKGESLSAEILGTMYGALHDPITLATLPIGSWVKGGSVLFNMARASGQEMVIESGAQAIIAPQVYDYKKEIGLKTTLKEEATNAVISIASAGLVRGLGSGAFDLTEKGIKALKAKNPEMGAEYEQLAKSNASESLINDIDNLHKVEFSDGEVTEIKNPNTIGEELNKAPSVPEDSDAIYIEPLDTEDLVMVTGRDIDGNIETKSYAEATQEVDNFDTMLNKINDCLIGGK